MKMPSMRFACIVSMLVLATNMTARADEGKVKRDGFDLFYRTEGSGQPAVILSGGPGFEVDYMKLAGDLLPAGFQKVYLEQRGTGRSKPPAFSAETFTLKLVVEDLEALRIALKQDRLFLVGHSWGGMYAMAYAAAYPDRVDRMILIGPGGPTLEFTTWFGDNIQARMRPEDIAAREYWAAAQKRGVDSEKAAPEDVRALTPAYFYDRAKGLAFSNSLTDGAFHGKVNSLLFADIAKQYDSRPGLRRLKRPVLIVHGHQDPVGDLTAQEIHSVISGSQLIFLSKCGHFPWLERREEFKRAVEDFLKRARS